MRRLLNDEFSSMKFMKKESIAGICGAFIHTEIIKQICQRVFKKDKSIYGELKWLL